MEETKILIDVISIVAVLSILFYGFAKLDEASRKIQEEEDRIYREHSMRRRK